MAEMEITGFEIVLIVSILLVVCMFIVIEEHLIAIIAFAILYHTFLYMRRQKCNWLRENAVIGE
jgi:hypothetical protein